MKAKSLRDRFMVVAVVPMVVLVMLMLMVLLVVSCKTWSAQFICVICKYETTPGYEAPVTTFQMFLHGGVFDNVEISSTWPKLQSTSPPEH